MTKKTGANPSMDGGGSAIIDLAIEEFSTLRSSGTSLKQIADLAGVKPELVTHYYKSLDNLWTACVSQLFDEAADQVKKGLLEDQAGTPDNPVIGLVNVLVEFAARRPQHFRILMLEEKPNNPRMDWIMEQSTAGIVSLSKILIEKAQKAGQVRPGDPTRLYYATIGLANSQFVNAEQYKRISDRDPFSAEEIQAVKELAYDFLGITTRSGD